MKVKNIKSAVRYFDIHQRQEVVCISFTTKTSKLVKKRGRRGGTKTLL